MLYHSSIPPHTAALENGDKTIVLDNGNKGSHMLAIKNLFGTSKWAAVFGGEGGQRRVILGGTTVIFIY